MYQAFAVPLIACCLSFVSTATALLMLSILPICRFSLQPPIAEDVLKFDPTCLQEPSGPPTSFSDAKSRSSLPECLLNKQQTGRQSIIIYILRAGPYALHFLRRLVLPKSVKQWSLRTLREKLIKIGAWSVIPVT